MSMDRQQLLSNTIALAKIAKIFAVPIILSVVETEHLSGRLFPELETLIPEENLIAHSTTNPWEVPAFVEAVKDVGQSRLLMAGVWTDVSLTFSALCALEEGYDAYVVTDTSGSISAAAHEAALGSGPIKFLVRIAMS